MVRCSDATAAGAVGAADVVSVPTVHGMATVVCAVVVCTHISGPEDRGGPLSWRAVDIGMGGTGEDVGLRTRGFLGLRYDNWRATINKGSRIRVVATPFFLLCYFGTHL